MKLSVEFVKIVLGNEFGKYPKYQGLVGERAVRLFSLGSEGNVAVATEISENDGLVGPQEFQWTQHNHNLEKDSDADMIITRPF